MIQNLVESYNIKTVQCCPEGKQNPTKLETPKKKKKETLHICDEMIFDKSLKPSVRCLFYKYH